MARPTLADIAAVAGVTPTTVSLVFRNQPGVSTALIKKILKLGLEMNYLTPPDVQKKRRGVKIYHIGLLFISQDEPRIYGGRGRSYLFKILSGCLEQAEKLKCATSIISATVDDFSREDFAEGLQNRHLDGIIVRGCYDEHIHEVLLSLNLPLVQLDCTNNFESNTQINLDNYYGMRLMLDHLIEKNAKRVAVITGDLEFVCAQECLAYVQYYAWKYKLELPDENIVPEHGYDEPSGRRGVELLLKKKCKFDTLICQNDLIAAGAYEALKSHNIRVPEDVKLVGSNNMELSNELPSITSINCQEEQQGAVAVSQLFSMFVNKDNPLALKIKITPSLFVGKTT